MAPRIAGGSTGREGLMRWLSVVAVAAVLVAGGTTAQGLQTPTPSPYATAAGTAWQLRGDPVFYSGPFYYPSSPKVFFDGNVMVQRGVYEDVPLYVDATLMPYSVGASDLPESVKEESEWLFTK
jgi:hypothetical protein